MANRKPNYDDLLTPEGVVCFGPEMTSALGEDIAGRLRVGSVVSMEGPLGAGKTQLVKGIVRALGCSDVASSPSFALLHEYVGGAEPVFHFDFYRMDSSDELLTAGYDDCLAEGITLIEWGNKYPEVLPEGALRLQFEILSSDSRRIVGHLVS